MKKIKCLDCEQEFTAETKDKVLGHMHPHYMQVHGDVMQAGNEESKKEWFTRFEENWARAEEV